MRRCIFQIQGVGNMAEGLDEMGFSAAAEAMQDDDWLGQWLFQPSPDVGAIGFVSSGQPKDRKANFAEYRGQGVAPLAAASAIKEEGVGFVGLLNHWAGNEVLDFSEDVNCTYFSGFERVRAIKRAHGFSFYIGEGGHVDSARHVIDFEFAWRSDIQNGLATLPDGFELVLVNELHQDRQLLMDRWVHHHMAPDGWQLAGPRRCVDLGTGCFNLPQRLVRKVGTLPEQKKVEKSENSSFVRLLSREKISRRNKR